LLFYKGLDCCLRDNVGAIACRALFPSARIVVTLGAPVTGPFVTIVVAVVVTETTVITA